jgi:ArsR family transcriptional regulator
MNPTLNNTSALLKAVEGLKAISHPARLKVLCSLLEGEKTVGELTRLTKLSQSGVSQHLAKMVGASILSSRRSGTQIFYGVTENRYRGLIEALCVLYGK